MNLGKKNNQTKTRYFFIQFTPAFNWTKQQPKAPISQTNTLQKAQIL